MVRVKEAVTRTILALGLLTLLGCSSEDEAGGELSPPGLPVPAANAAGQKDPKARKTPITAAQINRP